MQQNSEVLNKVIFLTGNADFARNLPYLPPMMPFEEKVINFLNDLSKALLKDKESKKYSDIVTFAFWIRIASVSRLKKRFELADDYVHLGRGVAFHIAPSNVPVNFAYSLVAGLLNGNANAVRVPSKEFVQVNILTNMINSVLESYEELKPYILCIRYDRDKEINDWFSSVSDIRIIWGGDQTIAELRKSPLPPRAGEITFADRYSMAVIDSDTYMEISDKDRIGEDFYNDTFFSDQNACTSPRIIIWMGSRIKEAKELFWSIEHELVEKKYIFQPVQGINKLVSSCLIAAAEPGVKVQKHDDNLIIRISVPKVNGSLMDYKDNSGYFFEYDCEDILEIKDICNDKRCQTIAYIGDSDVFRPLLDIGVKGIDRIVPIGKTMDFDLIWDGYNLPALMTRTVVMV